MDNKTNTVATTKDTAPQKDVTQHETKEATVCMALGAGVGTLGAVSAAITGAVCPLCVVIAPGLLGVGVYKRWQASKRCKEKLK